jgi:hypothetical protein
MAIHSPPQSSTKNWHSYSSSRRNKSPSSLPKFLWVLSALTLFAWSGWGSSQASEPEVVSTTATLSILTGTVRHISTGSPQSHIATDGMDLQIGDRIVTSAEATALVTFLDGSTLTVQPDSEVEVTVAEVSEKDSRINIWIHLGTVWARVTQLLDRSSSFSLESHSATATVHDGLIGGQQNPDGSFICWTRAGDLEVKNSEGQLLVTLKPGEKMTLQDHQMVGPQPFAVHQSTLKITATPNVLPLLMMPDKARVVGFVAPGLEVNQVFGSRTGMEGFGTRTIEIPAGFPGPFTLIVEGKRNTSFTVRVEGFYKETQVYHQILTGTIFKGQRLISMITQELDPNTDNNPKTAQVVNGHTEVFRAFHGSLPGTILVSPLEIQWLRELDQGATWSVPHIRHSIRVEGD